jgi:hypothetical protein
MKKTNVINLKLILNKADNLKKIVKKNNFY